MKPSQKLKRDAELMFAFRNAYVELVNNSKQVQGPYFSSVLAPRNPDTWAEQRAAVAAAAGAAASAYMRWGGTFTLKNAAYIMNNVNPLVNWEMSISDPEQMRPEAVISSVESATATAREMAAQAMQREGGLTGLIASFLRWPSDLREAVGPGHAAQRGAATFVGVVGQIVVGVITAALTAGVVAGAAALVQAVF